MARFSDILAKVIRIEYVIIKHGQLKVELLDYPGRPVTYGILDLGLGKVHLAAYLTHHTASHFMITACACNILMAFVLIIYCNKLKLFIGAVSL